MLDKRPLGRNNLDKSLHRMFPEDIRYFEMRSMMANVLVGQFLPEGVVKGGSSLKLRFGHAETRVTTDFDAAARYDRERFMADLEHNLSSGWEGFTFHVVKLPAARPDHPPAKYLMEPFSIKVDYCGKPWCTVDLELGYNELGDADEVEWVEDVDVRAAFRTLGFSAPGKIPVMPLSHQVAQKLHGLSEPDSERVHDLVDLQLIFSKATVDLPAVKRICRRLFAYRKMQAWPPTVAVNVRWPELYAAASSGMPVAQDVVEAVVWANELIKEIDMA